MSYMQWVQFSRVGRGTWSWKAASEPTFGTWAKRSLPCNCPVKHVFNRAYEFGTMAPR